MNIIFMKETQKSSITAITQPIPRVHNRPNFHHENWEILDYAYYTHYAHYGKSIMGTGSNMPIMFIMAAKTKVHNGDYVHYGS
jgi:hypothetical protein